METNDVASVVGALKPTSRWFAVVSGMTALAIWAYAPYPWAAWPTPVRCLVWGWLVSATFAPMYIFLVGTLIDAALAWLRLRAPMAEVANADTLVVEPEVVDLTRVKVEADPS